MKRLLGAWRLPIVGASGLSRVLADYFSALALFYLWGAKPEACRFLEPRSACWIYSLAASMRMLQRTHYRAPSFLHDVRANLSNVAVPCTGLPLSLFFLSSFTAWLFILVVYPLFALAAAGYMRWRTGQGSVVAQYREQLLQPKHWFALWRLNSFVVAFHAMVTEADPEISEQYALEGKGRFLLAAEAAGLPISPFMKDVHTIFAKHINIEGGMGIHVLKSFTQPGGEWILQEALTNSPELSRLLPLGVPLSTLRVVTASRHWLRTRKSLAGKGCNGSANGAAAAMKPAPGLAGEPGASRGGSGSFEPQPFDFSVLTVVLRAGRVGAATDHNAICFPVDFRTGLLSAGRSNQHWYLRGLKHALKMGPTFGKVFGQHPDRPGQIAGSRLAGMSAISELCISAHMRLLPDVPLVGWDVALTAEHGPVLLELNISCNFFEGHVAPDEYTRFVSAYIGAMHDRAL